jgi:putative spermidine/putrescine transport system permease protein
MLLSYGRLGGLKWGLWLIAVLVSAFLLLPVVFIGALSFGSSRWLIFPPPSWTLQWYQDVFSDPRWLESTLTSIKVAILVSITSVLLALPASFALVRGSFPGRQWLKGFFMTPMVMPVVVFAVALYALFLRIGLSGTLVGFVLAHTVLAFPFAVVAIVNSLQGFDKSIEDAAVLCGATPLQAKLKITLPSIRLGLLSAALFSFLMSWDEVVVAIFMASPTLQTLPVRIWGALRQDLSPAIAAVSTLLVLTTLAVMLVAATLRKVMSK